MLKKKQLKMFLKKKNIPFRSFEIKKRDEKTWENYFVFLF